MRIATAIAASLSLMISTALTAQESARQELEFNALYLNSIDGKAKAEDDSSILTDSTRERTGGTAPGILRYNLAKDDWYFTGDFYNIFISGGSWGGISLYKNGWGLNSEFSFSHGKSNSSFRSKNPTASSSSDVSSSPATQMAFGPAYSIISQDFRFETTVRYVLHKGGSTPFMSGYYENLKLTGLDLKIKVAKFYSITDSIGLGMGVDFQYLLSAKAEVSENYSIPREIEVEDISYISTMWYPFKLQLKF